MIYPHVINFWRKRDINFVPRVNTEVAFHVAFEVETGLSSFSVFFPFAFLLFTFIEDNDRILHFKLILNR